MTNFSGTDELKEWMEHREPLEILRTHLLARYKDVEPELTRIEIDAHKQVDESVAFAFNSPDPDYNDLINNVYVGYQPFR